MKRGHPARRATFNVALDRCGKLLLSLGISLAAAACVPPRSSFETLGIPEVQVEGGEGAIVLGWAREDRDGWVVQRVRIDQGRPESWDMERQQPRVIHLAPGEHALDVRATRQHSKNGAAGRSGATRRRYKLRPETFTIDAGEVQLCALQLTNVPRRRPRVVCSHLRGPGTAAPDRSATRARRPASPPTTAPASTETSRTPPIEEVLASLVQRLDRVEQQLKRLTGPCQPCPESCAGSGSHFAREFDDTIRQKAPSRRHRSHFAREFDDNSRQEAPDPHSFEPSFDTAFPE